MVITKYNNRSYKISDIAWGDTPAYKFETKEGMKTIKDFLKEKYQIEVKDMNQPLLVALPKDKDRRRGDTQDIRLENYVPI